jgi:hypothetical protein
MILKEQITASPGYLFKPMNEWKTLIPVKNRITECHFVFVFLRNKTNYGEKRTKKTEG